MGVRVSDTNPEIRIATTIVTENSCSSRPTIPPMNNTGNEHGHQRDRHRDDREADFARSCKRSLHARLAHFHVADDVLQHDDRVVHHKSDRERERHQRKIVQTVPEQVHHRESADDGEGNGESRNQRRREFRRNRKITITTSAMVSISVNSTSWIEPRIDSETSNGDRQINGGRESRAGTAGSSLRDPVHHFHRIGARLAADGKNHCALLR